MQIISNVALISINETLIIQLISFLIFLFVINRIMFRPLETTMNERDGYINGLNQDILDTEKEMGNILSQLETREAAIRKEASEIKSELEDEGNRKAAEIHTDFRNTIARLRRETEADVNVQITEARKQLKAESEVLAVGIMEKVLNRRLS